MKLKAKLVTALVCGALIIGALAWMPPAQAWEPLCLICDPIPYVGSRCTDISSGGYAFCTYSGYGACHTYGGSCNGLTSIQK